MECFSDTSVCNEKHTRRPKLSCPKPRPTRRTSPIPSISLSALCSVLFAALGGLILSSVVLVGAVDAQGQCLAQSLVLFSVSHRPHRQDMGVEDGQH